MLAEFKKQIDNEEIPNSGRYASDLRELKEQLYRLLGPSPAGNEQPVLMRDRYGETRWDMAKQTLQRILFIEKWDYSDTRAMGKKVLVSRFNEYKGTALEKLFPYLEANFENMMRPRLTFYWRFLTDSSFDSHMLGGIFPELLGTFYLVFGTMIFAVPMGVIAAVYLAEFSRPNSKIVSLLRVFISTLAGVPSIVFGLFGLAFFINTVKISNSKSVLAGSLTLALLVLPTIIRASEEAIKAVPGTYKEAALSLGANKLRAVISVILPAALPGILTGIVISMGRAAGETAPIIFTAAVSVGKPLHLLQTLTQPTPALSWNIYNLVTEHEAVERIRHVQFGMVFTLILLVLLLNLAALIIRARITKKLRG
jgi:phosphate transport system permease protein